jgi:hypothetical protein
MMKECGCLFLPALSFSLMRPRSAQVGTLSFLGFVDFSYFVWGGWREIGCRKEMNMAECNRRWLLATKVGSA